TVNPLPAANAGSDRAICLGQSTQIGAATVTGNTYNWTSSPTGFSSTVANPSVNPLVTTTYTLNETITATGCTKTNSVAVTVNPLPAAVAGTDRAICLGQSTHIGAASVTGHTYSWTSNPIGFSSTDANPTVNPLVTTTYTLTETITATGCTKTNSVIITVNPLPTAIISGTKGICVGEGAPLLIELTGIAPWNFILSDGINNYPVMGNYENPFDVNVFPEITTTFSVISVTDATDCSNSGTGDAVITVNPLLPVSVSVSPSANPVLAGTLVKFTATPAYEGSSPSYQWKVNNEIATVSSDSSFSYIPSNNDAVACVLTSSEICVSGNPAHSNTVTMIVNSTPENASVSGEITQSACYAATNTISVAGIVNGSPTIFIIHPGGSTTMIAGQKIRYLQGTFIHSGGYLRGYIAPTGPYCSPPHFIAIMSDKEGIQQTPETTNIKIYPNPTTGSFVLELPGEYNVQDTRVKIYGMRGDLVLSLEQLNDRRQRVDLSRQPAGIYLVQVTDGKLAYRTKIIKTY
ncbi:MAG: T9SS type A sorting domain-containing protein, partial [Bacteroidota bacterium]